MTGATDWNACRTRTPRGLNCRCTPCAVCGHGEHAAIHGPDFGKPVGSKPFGHQFIPASAPSPSAGAAKEHDSKKI